MLKILGAVISKTLPVKVEPAGINKEPSTVQISSGLVNVTVSPAVAASDLNLSLKATSKTLPSKMIYLWLVTLTSLLGAFFLTFKF